MKEIEPKRSAASWLAELAKGRYGEYALSVLTALLGVVVNLRFPRFDYLNETAVIKQSMSTMICMFGSMAVVLVLSLVYALLLSAASPVAYLLGCLVLLTAAKIFMWNYLARGGSIRFAALQAD